MPSSYSTGTGFELIPTGAQAGTWGDSTNNNLKKVDQCLTQYSEVAVDDDYSGWNSGTAIDSVTGTLTWTLDDSSEALASGSEARAPFVKFSVGTGANPPAANFNVRIQGETQTYPPRFFWALNGTAFSIFFYIGSADTVAKCFELQPGDVVPLVTYIDSTPANSYVWPATSMLNCNGLRLVPRSKGQLSGTAPEFVLDADSDSNYFGANTVAIGKDAGKPAVGTTTQIQDVFIGSLAGDSVAGAVNSVFIGYRAGATITSADNNVFVGSQAGDSCTGTGNVGIGFRACNGFIEGDYNTAIGFYAGSGVSTQSKNILIGYDVGSSDVEEDSILIIDYENHNNDKSTLQFIYGDMANDKLHVNSDHTSNNVLTVNNTNATYTGNALHLTTTDAADAGFNFIKADANTVNQFRVNGAGTIYAQNTTVQAADYADMFEWSDGNPEAEDRIGLTVVVDGGLSGGVRPATSSDDPEDVVGAVSGTACMIGNAAWAHWDNKFLKDGFGRVVTHTVDEKPTATINPDFEESREYIPRMARSDWAVIGMTGRIHIRKGAPVHPSWRKLRDVSAVTEEWLVR